MDNDKYEVSDLLILKELVRQYGEDLIDEITYVVSENGQGDCYGCLCSYYCIGNSCFNAIKKVVKEMLEVEEVNDQTLQYTILTSQKEVNNERT